MPLRKFHRRNILSSKLQKRFRSTTSNSSGVNNTESKKREILQNFISDRDKYSEQPSQNNTNDRARLIEQFNRQQRELSKRGKRYNFSPHSDEVINIGPDPDPVDVCAVFDTGFEDDCDYISRLYLLGPYTILENYEASTTETIQPMMIDFHPVIQNEDWETTSGYMIDFTQSPATTSDIVGSDVFIGTPQNFTLTKDLSLSSIELTWSDVENEDNYVVERSDGDDQNYVVLDTLSANTTSYVDNNNLILDTQYYYRVKGTNSEFDGAYATNNITFEEVEENQEYMLFDGTNDYVELDSIVDDILDSNKFEFECNFFTNKSTGVIQSHILFSAHSSSYGNLIRFGVSPVDGGIFIGSDILGDDMSFGSGYNDSNVHNLHILLEDGNLEITVDDVLLDTSGVTPTLNSSNIAHVSIGQEYDPGPTTGDFFSGLIYNVKISSDDVLISQYSGSEIDVWTDEVGNNNGTVFGDPVTTQFALDFDGTNDYVETSRLLDTKTWAVELKLTPHSNSNPATFFEQYIGSSGDSGRFICAFSRFGSNSVDIFQDGVWTEGVTDITGLSEIHIGLVCDNGEISLYINGVLEYTRSNFLIPSDTTFKLGGTWNFYGGDMYYNRIWNTARTQSEIQDNMNSTLTGSESGLVAYWKMDEGSGTTLNDSAGNNDGTINGATWVTI